MRGRATGCAARRDVLGQIPTARAYGALARVAARHEAPPAQIALAWLLHRSPVVVDAAAIELSKADLRALLGADG